MRHAAVLQQIGSLLPVPPALPMLLLLVVVVLLLRCESAASYPAPPVIVMNECAPLLRCLLSVACAADFVGAALHCMHWTATLRRWQRG